MKLYLPHKNRFFIEEADTTEDVSKAVEVTDEEYASLLQELQKPGMETKTGPSGKPYAAPIPKPSPEFLEAVASSQVRGERAALLRNTDWVVIKFQETGQPVPPEWSAYRQALRDITDQPGFPLDVVWPTEPGGN
jgi:hypothetical protein